MNIGIDARSLEESKTGVGRYLSNLLRYWKNAKEFEFVLYFKDKLPKDSLINSVNFDLKLLKNPLGFSSNFFFQHFLLPYNLKKDSVSFFFSPFYLKPFYCPVKSSIVLHDISYEVYPEWFNSKSQFILRALSRFSAKTSSVIFTVSDYSKSEIVKYYKISPNKIKAVHLAVDDDFVLIRDLKKIREIKKKYKLNRFILCVGSIFNRRHTLDIIGAFEKIAQKFTDFQLLILGKNHTYPFIDIEDKINKVNRNLQKNAIIHLDFVSDYELLVFYSSCEFCVYLSEYEGFGLPLIEAQFFNKPVVTSCNTALLEIGQNSVEFVDSNTVSNIYKSLEKLITDNEYKKRLVELGKENIKRFSWEKCANETLDTIVNKLK